MGIEAQEEFDKELESIGFLGVLAFGTAVVANLLVLFVLALVVVGAL